MPRLVTPPSRPSRRRLVAASVVPALVLAWAAPSVAADREPAAIEVSGIPSVLGRGQAVPINVSGRVPENLLFGGGKLSVVVTAEARDHSPEGACTTGDPSAVLLARTVSTATFSFTKTTRVRSDFAFDSGESYRYRICASIYPNALQPNQPYTDATFARPRAVAFRLRGHRATLPHRVTGRVLTATGDGVGGASVAASGAGGGSAFTGPNGRYDLFLGRGTARLTPSLPGATFAPGSRSVRVPSSRAQDFVATVPAG